MHPIHSRVLMLAAVTLVASAASSADPATGLSSIRETAERAVRQAVHMDNGTLIVRMQGLDPRLRLAPCDQPLTATISGDGQPRAHSTVAVRCDGSVHWTLYVAASIESEFQVLVAKRPLSRDAELSPADFEVQTRHLPGLTTDYVTDPGVLAGQRLRQPLTSGEALSLEALTPTNLIHRGQQVTLVASAGGFEVRMNAVALADGRLSDRIRVQNLSSQRVVEGIVRSNTLVEVPL